ncbi:hypothetical protein KY362_03135 [Candidatus Woesearchaeota archaeon]|nr:hypothetical protein [Candidatus Woesearchaeota archaeon]
MSVDKRIKEVNKHIARVSPVTPGSYNYKAVGFAMVLLIMLAGAAIYFGPGITGFVTFSQTTSKTQTEDFTVTKSGEVNIRTDLDSINALLLSGTVYGEGTASVFLLKDDRKILAYHFEGNAEGGVDFDEMCYGTCHVEGMGRANTLLFELDGTMIHIDDIKYMYSKIIEFNLLPEENQIYYPEEKARVVNLVLTNDQLTDFKVILYIAGPLSEYFSYPGSIIVMTSDEQEKTIPITVKLPADLPAGTYDHRITARYIPPSDYDFVGESPVAESFITVHST